MSIVNESITDSQMLLNNFYIAISNERIVCKYIDQKKI